MLNAMRVLEVYGTEAARYCTRLLASCGADVVRVEQPPNPDQIDAESDLEVARGLWLDGQKLGVQLDSGSETDRTTLTRLAGAADVIVHSVEPDTQTHDAIQLGAAATENPLVISLTPFGNDGPYAGYRATHLVEQALSGYMYCNGETNRQPLAGVHLHEQAIAGLHGFIAVLAETIGRIRGVRHESVEIATMECMTTMHYETFPMVRANGGTRPRTGNKYPDSHPLTIWPCKDGYVSVAIVRPHQWDLFCKLLSIPALTEDPRFATPTLRSENWEALNDAVLPWLMERTRAQIFEECQAYRIPSAPVWNSAELLSNPHLAARNFWKPGTTVDGRSVVVGWPPFRVEGASMTVGAAPPTGQDAAKVASRWEATPSEWPSRLRSAALRSGVGSLTGSNEDLPLAGIRIADLSQAWAGPVATRLLGQLGAEVIKVEAPFARGPKALPPGSNLSTYPGAAEPDRPWNQQGVFNELNQNKQSLCVDMRFPEGLDLVKRLIAKSDILIENYAPRVMPNFGLSYDEVHAINERVVMVSMPGFGSSGPYSGFVLWGPINEPASGLSSITGYPGGGPLRTGIALSDPTSGVTGAAATVLGLLRRALSGEGGFVEVSHHEAVSALAGDEVVRYQLSGILGVPSGNRDDQCSPCDAYRCLGEDSWIAISVGSSDEWRRLCECMGRLDLAAEGTLQSVDGRRSARDRIDEAISLWTRARNHLEIMEKLQAAGVAAGAVLTGPELFHDRHLRARNSFVPVADYEAGLNEYPRLPIRINGLDIRSEPAPTLGRHNAHVVVDVLGLSTDRMRELAAAGVLADEPPEADG